MHAKAETQLVDARVNWRSLLQHHRAFAPCDDGALAEGYSDAVASLLAQSKEQFSELKVLVKEYSYFLEWVLLHVDSSASSDDLEKVITNGESCAKTSELATLCSRIEQKAKNALAELSPVDSREQREIKMADHTIFRALAAGASKEGQAACSQNSLACSDDRAELGLALQGGKASQESLKAFISLIRYRIDAGLSEDFFCYALEKEDALLEEIRKTKTETLRTECGAQFKKARAGSSPIFNTLDENSICATEKSMRSQLKELTAALTEKKKCHPEDF